MEAFAHVPSMTFLKANRTFTGSNKGMRWKIYFDEGRCVAGTLLL